MKTSWKIGSISGIAIYIHVTFLLLLGWVGLSHFLQHHQWTDAVADVGFIIVLFAIVVLHELGHALTAKHYGIPTRDITLLPIGGVARLERLPENPRQELLVALAGPAVNVVLALLFLGATFLTGDSLAGPETAKFTGSHVLTRLFWANVTLAVFNLLPAFPMDGGRVLRALLAMRIGRASATRIAASIGKMMALLFGFVGLVFNPLLVLIAVFVWIGAEQEAGEVRLKSTLATLPVARVMMTEFHALKPDSPLSWAVEYVLSGAQHDFPVVENGKAVGVLTHTDLLRALASKGQTACVRDVMRRDFRTAGIEETVETALGRLAEDDCRTVPVMCHGVVVGLLTLENIGEYLAIDAALRDASQFRLKTLQPSGV